MRALALTGLIALALAAAVVLALGLDERAARLALSLQRDYQNALAGALQALRGGDAGAVGGFMGICFAYGFLHALGPGHGKAVIGAYGLAGGARLGGLVGLSLISALAQATVAVALVYAGVWLLGGARDRIEALAGRIEPLGALAIALLGLFILLRGLRRMRSAGHRHDHHHDHDHGADCGCGHAHAPDPEAVAASRNWREALSLIAAVALRPCTGALFLLILTWRFGLDGLGIAGAYVMAFGTFMVTGLAAALALGLRKGLLASVPGLKGAPRIASAIEIGFGALILILGLTTTFRLL